MPKSKDKHFSRKFNEQWLSEAWSFGWLAKNTGPGVQEAFCKLCKNSLRAHKTDLIKHTSTLLHKKKAQGLVLSSTNKITHHACPINISDKDKERDLIFTYYVAMHTSIKAVDHLCDVLNRFLASQSESQTKLVKLHRTKCSQLIKNVLNTSLLQELQDLNDSPFSLIVDESTDVSVEKYLCICIKYFSPKLKQIVTDFLGIVSVESATADALFKYLHDFLTNLKLDLKNLIGIGTDGANNMCGKNHSLFTILKSHCPQMQLIKCICHSLNLCASKASDELPANIDFLCREIYNWFSPQRKAAYLRVFNMLNAGEKKFHNFKQLSHTRWLVHFDVINTILENWEELKTHFHFVIDKEKCLTARMLNEILQDDSTLLILTIVKPILYESNNLNMTFQRDNAKIGKSYDDLTGFIMFLCRKIMKPVFTNTGFDTVMTNINNSLAYVNPEQADFGIDYFRLLSKIKISDEKKYMAQCKAFKFVKTFIFEIHKRLPENLIFFKNMCYFSPSFCISPTARSKFSNLPFIHQFAETKDLSNLETEYNKLLDVNWYNTFECDVVQDPYKFWPSLLNFEDAVGNHPFEQIAKFAIKVICLPSSNAVVERVFSIMNTIKPKIRNRMQFNMLSSLLRIRVHSYVHKKCCSTFQPTPLMHKLFNSKNVYNSDGQSKSNSNETTENDDDLEIISAFEDFVPCLSL